MSRPPLPSQQLHVRKTRGPQASSVTSLLYVFTDPRIQFNQGARARGVSRSSHTLASLGKLCDTSRYSKIALSLKSGRESHVFWLGLSNRSGSCLRENKVLPAVENVYIGSQNLYDGALVRVHSHSAPFHQSVRIVGMTTKLRHASKWTQHHAVTSNLSRRLSNRDPVTLRHEDIRTVPQVCPP